MYSGVCSAQSNMVTIPMTSLDGVSPIPVAINVPPFPTEFCGGLFGISTGAVATPVQSKLKGIHGDYLQIWIYKNSNFLKLKY